jgi:hypothetical protein
MPPDVRRQLERSIKDGQKTLRTAIDQLQVQVRRTAKQADVDKALKRLEGLSKQVQKLAVDMAARGAARASSRPRRAAATAKRATSTTRKRAATTRKPATRKASTRSTSTRPAAPRRAPRRRTTPPSNDAASQESPSPLEAGETGES